MRILRFEACSTFTHVLAESFAVAGQADNAWWPQHLGWPLESLAALPENRRETLGNALDALAALPEPFDVIRGWALQELKSELDQHGLLPEAMALAFSTLSNRFQVRQSTLRSLVEQGGTSYHELLETAAALHLVAAIGQLEDPYLRFRGYYQLMRDFSDLRVELLGVPQAEDERREGGLLHRLTSIVFPMGPTFSALAPRAASDIANPSQRAWALERLACVAEDPRKWLDQARRAALLGTFNRHADLIHDEAVYRDLCPNRRGKEREERNQPSKPTERIGDGVKTSHDSILL